MQRGSLSLFGGLLFLVLPSDAVRYPNSKRFVDRTFGPMAWWRFGRYRLNRHQTFVPVRACRERAALACREVARFSSRGASLSLRVCRTRMSLRSSSKPLRVRL